MRAISGEWTQQNSPSLGNKDLVMHPKALGNWRRKKHHGNILPGQENFQSQILNCTCELSLNSTRRKEVCRPSLIRSIVRPNSLTVGRYNTHFPGY